MSELISFEEGDHVLILPTPYNKAKEALGELKGLEFNKEYVVADAYCIWNKWHVLVYLDENREKISEFVNGSFFAKK